MLAKTGKPSSAIVEPLHAVILPEIGIDSRRFPQSLSDHYDHLGFQYIFQSKFVTHVSKTHHSQMESRHDLREINADKVKKLNAGGVSMKIRSLNAH